ncbi:hypothetical protein ORJ04_03500 [Rheinheimera baltica]|uniref:Uncharacterized protein n=1 Tax=Rheinheimera baltica TaxID=67576 RepID=A0ABT9HV59_9GAMM|nr:hypothetical protein [Rheinheimera baltica]MDP5135012.1 hypothetical protein [Rheinheimera baltica]
MSQDNNVAVFDRFGWYWQPAAWLDNMSPQDALKATQQAINIQPLEQSMLRQAAEDEHQAAAMFTAQQDMLNSLYDD